MLMVEENIRPSKVMVVSANGPLDFTDLETKMRKNIHWMQYWYADSPMDSSVAMSCRVRWSEGICKGLLITFNNYKTC